jgi:hypothetical protein
MTYLTDAHPAETELALYAGGDLPWFRQWRTERHVHRCSECQQSAAEYSELRAAPATVTGLNWNRVASEMKANIRLGLSAGECVGGRLAPRNVVSGSRLILAGGLLCVLVAVGAYLSRPNLHPGVSSRITSGTVLEAAESGIQVRGVRQTLRILNPATTRNVVYTVGAQAELQARSLDPATGNVAIVHVYGE